MKRGVSIESFKDKVDPSPQVRELREQLKSAQHRIDELKQSIGSDHELLASLKESIHALPPPVVAYAPPKKGKRVQSPCSAVNHFCDWHIGEVVQADEVEDFNAFNWSIAQMRMAAFLRTTLSLTEIARTNYEIPELVVICTGDFVSGDIHPELQVTNEFPVPVQCCNSGGLLAKVISEQSKHFAQVRVEFIVPDNHSRLTKKCQFKQGGFNSYGYIVGFIAKEMLRDHPNVVFNIYPAPQQVVQVQNVRYLCQHGHTIKGVWGIPYYGIERVASQGAKARMNRPDRHKFHKLIIGHFHAPLRQTWWQVGGSLSGTNELDHALNRYAGPCQTMWFVHPKHGEFNYNEIWLAQGSPLGVPGSGA